MVVDVGSSGVVLSGVVLSGSVLSGVVLSGSVLSDVMSSGPMLSGVVLSGSVLSGVVFSGSVLSGFGFSESVLSKVEFSGVEFSGVELSGVELSGIVSAGTLSASPTPLDVTSSTEGLDGSAKELVEKPSRRRFSCSAVQKDEMLVIGLKDESTYCTQSSTTLRRHYAGQEFHPTTLKTIIRS